MRKSMITFNRNRNSESTYACQITNSYHKYKSLKFNILKNTLVISYTK